MENENATLLEEFITCDCIDEGVLLRRFIFPSEPEPQDKDFVYLSIWNQGQPNSTLRYKLRLIWHVIRTGSYYTDQILLNKEGVKRVKDFCDAALAENTLIPEYFDRKRPHGDS